MAQSGRFEISDDRTFVAGLAHSDAPVGGEADELGRKRFAELIASQIALSRPASGIVMSLTGAWGTGKSSVLRMVTESLEAGDAEDGIIVINYNPWFFSGTDQLISGFLLTLADQLPRSLGGTAAANVADRLRRYGTAVGTLRSLPALGGILGVVSDVERRALRG
jgi:predicted KAP-like P-loop ATPase